MAPSIPVTKKKRGRGRPRTGIGPHVGLRLYADLQARLDAWIAKQGDPELGRPEAIRRVLDKALPPLAASESAKPRRPAKKGES
jgi:hypothetical protein